MNSPSFIEFTMLRSLFAAVCLLTLVMPAYAQLQIPRLNSIFPCGGKQGTTVDTVIAGGELTDATGLYFSHPGITAKPAGPGKFKVAIAKDVPLGPYDVRVITPLGLSNFRAFVVGDVPEVQEKEPNNEPSQAQRVSLPVVINGRMDGGNDGDSKKGPQKKSHQGPAGQPPRRHPCGGTDVDFYVFAAKKGQRIVI